MKKIVLKKLTLANFRNIASATYTFNNKVNAISGNNGIGKTNTLEAISYLLTDKQLDFSYSPIDNKPKGQTDVHVVIDSVFEIDGAEYKIEKHYREVYSRDQIEKVLTKHDTYYVIGAVDNPIKYTKVSDALLEINKLFGFVDRTKIPFKLNPTTMMVNPLYLPFKDNAKELRELVINIVGDVTDEEVFEQIGTSGEKARNLLRQYNGDTSKAKKSCLQAIKGIEQQLMVCDSNIAKYSEEVDVSSAALEESTNKINLFNKQIFDLQNGHMVEDPIIEKLNDEVGKLKQKQIELTESSMKNITEYNKNIQDQLTELNAACSNKRNERNALVDKKNSLELEIGKLNQQNRELSIKIDFDENSLTEFRTMYKNKKNETFNEDAFEKVTCPNCGTVVNEPIIEAARKQFEEQKTKYQNELIEKANKLKLKIDENKFLIEDLQDKLLKLVNELTDVEKQIEELSKAITKNEQLIGELSHQMKSFTDTPEIQSIKNEISSKLAQIAETKKNQEYAYSKDITLKIYELKVAINNEQEVVDKHNQYLFYQREIGVNKQQKEMLEANNIEWRQAAYAIDLFLKTKLEMLTEKVNRVFKRTKFTLVEYNMKEGSWNDVCYPMNIKHPTIAYEYASTSEKIRTGIALLEDIKEALELPNMPIIFDEGETLDSASYNELKTDSQVITTYVSDKYTNAQVIDIRNRG